MIKVNKNQKGNNVLIHLNKSHWHYDDIPTDYEINNTTSIIFLSIRFHVSKPEYIHKRIKRIRSPYKNNILIIKIDSTNYESLMKEIFIIGNIYNYTIIMCFKDEEIACYLQSFDIKNVSSDRLSKKEEDKFSEFFKKFQKINSTDIIKIKESFGSIKEMVETSDSKLEGIEGLGTTKVSNMRKYLNMKFKP